MEVSPRNMLIGPVADALDVVELAENLSISWKSQIPKLLSTGSSISKPIRDYHAGNRSDHSNYCGRYGYYVAVHERLPGNV